MADGRTEKATILLNSLYRLRIRKLRQNTKGDVTYFSWDNDLKRFLVSYTSNSYVWS